MASDEQAGDLVAYSSRNSIAAWICDVGRRANRRPVVGLMIRILLHQLQLYRTTFSLRRKHEVFFSILVRDQR
jgi:hypothetical protein